MTATWTASRGDRTRSEIKSFIRAYLEQNQCSPSIAEIAGGIGLSSSNAVRSHLLMLRARGEVTWADGCSRTVRVLD